VAFVFALLAASCMKRLEPHPVPTPREVLRDDARLVLEKHCGQCHIGAYPTAVPRALAVFDLSETQWSNKMSPAQLRSAVARLSAPLSPTGAQNEVAPKERDDVRRFVDLELARPAP
jgi:hypothetical protein